MTYNRRVSIPCCWITGRDVCTVLRMAELRAAAPIRVRFAWWAQLRALQTVRGLFF
jgi:hypothetical protein